MPRYRRLPGDNRYSNGQPCKVIVHRKTRLLCGRPNWGWTNYMEPICLEHFQQRLFLQRWMELQQGKNWAALVVAANPQGFLDVDETEESKQRRNLKHIREVQDTLRESLNRGRRT